MVVPPHIWSLALVLLNFMSEQVLSSASVNRYPDYREHRCNRDCDDDPDEKTCEYEFTLEYYYTLTQACHNCPYNVTDCYRPHCVSADGVSRGLLTVNRMMPGPAIRVCEDDDIVVNVKNNMEGGEGTAIHWHGILQSQTPHMDGVSMLTQCPIHLHSKFQYKFKADTPGTHFWHAHSGLQRADGVYGAIVIKQKKSREPQRHLYDYDIPEHTILLSDWITEMGAVRFSGHHHAMTEHFPSSILINGKGTKREFRMQNNAHSAHMGHMMHTMGMTHGAPPTSSPMAHHMSNSDSDNNMDALHTMAHHTMESLPTMAQTMEALPTLSQSDMENMMHEAHRMRRGTESVMTMPTNGDNENMPDMDKDHAMFTPQPVFTVKPMKRYRFRIISNGVNNCPIQFSIDNHTMTMIASDGSPFKPLEVQYFNIFAGERYDFVLFTNNHVGNYWIRTRGLADCMLKRARQTAILRYEGTTPENPKESTEYEAFERKGTLLNPFNRNSGPLEVNAYELESVVPDEAPLKTEPDKRFYLGFDFNMVDNYRFNDPDLYPLSNMIGHAHHMGSPQINGITHVMPSSPPLSQYSKYVEQGFCNEDTIQKNCKHEFCECIHRVKVKLGEEVELVLVDEGKMQDNNHPMHLHGYKFKVIGMAKLGNSTTVKHIKQLDHMGLIKRNLKHPISKDTVTVPDGGYTIIRFHANNPGFWLFHCHIAFHMEMGMNMIIQVGEVNEMLPPPPHFPKCGDWTPESVAMAKKEDDSTPQKQLSCPQITNTAPPSTSPAIPPVFIFLFSQFFSECLMNN
ncbi:hypothetical protein FSP39_012795 [Pinctada imbricata]|uniref:Uncharacterized protein n=1 Tax=Pinctada imbricata TaxID=66713 RepID=A0AA89BSR4_PINIB|nr:hypothetical protein FSP39_012795 [Pinctada imbricata]